MAPLGRDRRKIVDVQDVQRKSLLLPDRADDLLQPLLQRNLRVQACDRIGLRLADHNVLLFLLVADVERTSDDLHGCAVVRVHRIPLVAEPDARLLVHIRAQVIGKCLVPVLHAVAQRGKYIRILLRDETALAHRAPEIRNAQPVARRHPLDAAALHELARRDPVLPETALNHTADDAVFGLLLFQLLLQFPYSLLIGSSVLPALFHTFLPSPNTFIPDILRYCGIWIALATLSASSGFRARSSSSANSFDTPIPLPVINFPSTVTDSPVTVAPSSFSSKPG